MDGTPCTRGSSSTAARNARATALYCGLGDVVPVAASVDDHVQRDGRVVGERLEDVPGQRSGVVRSDGGWRPVRLVVDEVGPAGQVDRGLDERLVHRHERVAEPSGPGLVAGGLSERLPERDRGVLDGVMRIDMQVSLDLDPQVEQPVLAERREHVVVETHAGRHVGTADAVEVDLDQHLGLARLPVDPADAGHRKNLH